MENNRPIAEDSSRSISSSKKASIVSGLHQMDHKPNATSATTNSLSSVQSASSSQTPANAAHSIPKNPLNPPSSNDSASTVETSNSEAPQHQTFIPQQIHTPPVSASGRPPMVPGNRATANVQTLPTASPVTVGESDASVSASESQRGHQQSLQHSSNREVQQPSKDGRPPKPPAPTRVSSSSSNSAHEGETTQKTIISTTQITTTSVPIFESSLAGPSTMESPSAVQQPQSQQLSPQPQATTTITVESALPVPTAQPESIAFVSSGGDGTAPTVTHVVTKTKGRFKLLQEVPVSSSSSDPKAHGTTSTVETVTTAAKAIDMDAQLAAAPERSSQPVRRNSGSSDAINRTTDTEVASSTTHVVAGNNTRETSFGSVPKQSIEANLTSSDAVANTTTPARAPVIKKKGRFVITSVTDPNAQMVPITLTTPTMIATIPGTTAAPTTTETAAAQQQHLNVASSANNPSREQQGTLVYATPAQATVIGMVPTQQVVYTTAATASTPTSTTAATLSSRSVETTQNETLNTNNSVYIDSAQQTSSKLQTEQQQQNDMTALKVTTASSKASDGQNNDVSKAVRQQRTKSNLHSLDGLHKVLYLLDQMKSEVLDAQCTIKTLQDEIKSMQNDMKFLKEKNKEMEAKAREAERKCNEERSLRETADAKLKALRKRFQEMKEERSLLTMNGEGAAETKISIPDAGEPVVLQQTTTSAASTDAPIKTTKDAGQYLSIKPSSREAPETDVHQSQLDAAGKTESQVCNSVEQENLTANTASTASRSARLQGDQGAVSKEINASRGTASETISNGDTSTLESSSETKLKSAPYGHVSKPPPSNHSTNTSSVDKGARGVSRAASCSVFESKQKEPTFRNQASAKSTFGNAPNNGENKKIEPVSNQQTTSALNGQVQKQNAASDAAIVSDGGRGVNRAVSSIGFDSKQQQNADTMNRSVNSTSRSQSSASAQKSTVSDFDPLGPQSNATNSNGKSASDAQSSSPPLGPSKDTRSIQDHHHHQMLAQGHLPVLMMDQQAMAYPIVSVATNVQGTDYMAMQTQPFVQMPQQSFLNADGTTTQSQTFVQMPAHQAVFSTNGTMAHHQSQTTASYQEYAPSGMFVLQQSEVPNQNPQMMTFQQPIFQFQGNLATPQHAIHPGGSWNGQPHEFMTMLKQETSASEPQIPRQTKNVTDFDPLNTATSSTNGKNDTSSLDPFDDLVARSKGGN